MNTWYFSLQINDTAAASAELYEGLMEGVQAEPEVVVPDAPGAAAVAVDWIRDRLYWSSPENRTLWRTNLRGGERTLVIHDTGNITQQNNLVLDPREGYALSVTSQGFEYDPIKVSCYTQYDIRPEYFTLYLVR